MESANDPQRTPQLFPRQIQQLYFNGFQLGLSNADVQLMIHQNNRPLVGLNLSYTTAKTLGQKLLEVISVLERESKNTIMSIDDVGRILPKVIQEKGE